jgi:hypothetical protein
VLYAFLCYNDEAVVCAWSKDEEAAVMTQLGAVTDKLTREGRLGPVARLVPSTAATTLRKDRDPPLVIDGPFAETKELIAGFWLWQVRSMDEAVEWVKRCPNPHEGKSEIEIRQVFEAEDFGAEFTPELRKREERVRAKVAAKKRSRRG